MDKNILKEETHVKVLRCEYMLNPVGIDVKEPRFSWEILSSKRGTIQSAYQLIIAESLEDLDNSIDLIYDTGKVISEESFNVKYNGQELKSEKEYFWKVRIWNENHEPTEWSDASFFETAFLCKVDWKAKWIEPNQIPVKPDVINSMEEIFHSDHTDEIRTYDDLNPCLLIRKKFSAKGKIKRARIYTTSHGIYNLELNGSNVGDIELAPEVTAYDDYLQYQTYNITSLISQGDNIIGATLSNGWYAGCIGGPGTNCNYGDMLGLLMQLDIEYEDGKVQTVISDESFKSSTGPFVYSDITVGERYDARLEKYGWSTVEFDDSDWQHVNEVDYGYENLVAQYGEPIRVVEEIKPIAIITTPKGEKIIDLGQNIAGRLRIKVSGTAGTEVILEHSEVLDKHGNFLNNIMGKNKDQKDIYVLKGEGEEVYEPKFTFHGFRYVRITGYPGELCIENFKGIVLCSDMRITGSFECSNDKINKLQKNIVWSQKGNMLSIPMDCPQRERAGWTGDIHVYGPTAAFNMDVNAFLTRWLRNVVVEQREDGQVPMMIPYWKGYQTVGKFLFGGIHTSAAWGDVCVILPWILYNNYGDKDVLRENYETMVKWLDYVEKEASENIPENIEGELTEEHKENQKYLWNTGFHFGDWLIPSKCANGEDPMEGALETKELVASCFYAYSTELMVKISSLLDKDVEAQKYQELNKKICKAFTSEYLNEDGSFKAHFQGIYVLALQMNMVPDQMVSKVASYLVELIRENGNRLDTGFASIGFIMDVLCKNGYSDLAYKLLYQTECPSWLYEVEKGATTIWESWNAITPSGEVTNSSYNHYAFGCVGDWLYKFVAGLDKDKPGYKHIVIKPEPDRILTYAKASYKSIHGEIISGWKLEDGKMVVNVKIPANTTATVLLPKSDVSKVSESNLDVKIAKGIISSKQQGDKAQLEIGSGEYVFEYEYM